MSFWQRLKQGLKKSADTISTNLSSVFSRKKLDHETLDALEEAMILADMGIKTASEIKAQLAREKLDQDISEPELKEWLAQRLNLILEPVAKTLTLDRTNSTQVILVVGVNGSGKTTNIAKIADYYKSQGKSVHVAACDTFRAAASEQLAVWADRVGFYLYKTIEGADSSGLAYEALSQAQKNKIDVLIIDTAGRLHNKKNLMEELKKMVRVLKKLDETAPHHTLLVLDATTGQNAIQQTDEFLNTVNVNGLILTKLDGTAKGGIVISIAEKYKLPIYFLGVGEQVKDLQPFTSLEFARNLLGIAVTLDSHEK